MSLLKRKEEVKKFLKELVRENNLDGIILADAEGLPVISYVSENLDEEVVSASLAAILSAGDISASDAGKKGLKHVIVDTDEGYIIVFPVANDFIVGVITPLDAKLGMVKLVVKELEEYMQNLSKK